MPMKLMTRYDTGLFHPDPPLLPLRTSDLDTEFYHTDMKVLADHFHGQLTVLYCVPTNPGPRSFRAWPVRRCHWRTSYSIARLLKPYSNLGPPIFRPPRVHEPVPNISRSRISRPPESPSLTAVSRRLKPASYSLIVVRPTPLASSTVETGP